MITLEVKAQNLLDTLKAFKKYSNVVTFQHISRDTAPMIVGYTKSNSIVMCYINDCIISSNLEDELDNIPIVNIKDLIVALEEAILLGQDKVIIEVDWSVIKVNNRELCNRINEQYFKLPECGKEIWRTNITFNKIRKNYINFVAKNKGRAIDYLYFDGRYIAATNGHILIVEDVDNSTIYKEHVLIAPEVIKCAHDRKSDIYVACCEKYTITMVDDFFFYTENDNFPDWRSLFYDNKFYKIFSVENSKKLTDILKIAKKIKDYQYQSITFKNKDNKLYVTYTGNDKEIHIDGVIHAEFFYEVIFQVKYIENILKFARKNNLVHFYAKKDKEISNAIHHIDVGIDNIGIFIMPIANENPVIVNDIKQFDLLDTKEINFQRW